jgi:DNA polymerase elongation subunit (family B)
MFPREQKILSFPDKALEFQIVSWHTCDFDYSCDDDTESSSSSISTNDNDDARYLIKMFGVTRQGQSVSLNVLNFTPFFFIKVEHSLNRVILNRLHEYIVAKLPYKLKHSLVSVKPMRRKDFWGFHNGEEFQFIRFAFKSNKAYRAGIRVFQREVTIPGLTPQCYQLYESNIDPFLRFIHLRDIAPVGWVRVEDFELNECILPTRCQIDINIQWTHIHNAHIEQIAPIMVASFDIECVSSHGDFPVARKDYKKVAYEFFQLYETKKDAVDDIKDYMFMQLMSIFEGPNDYDAMSKVFLKRPLSQDALRKLKTRVRTRMDDIVNYASGKVLYASNKTQPSKDDIMRKLTETFGYFEHKQDEYTRQTVETTWKGLFPELEGDAMIQIGTTVHSYGDIDCSYRHIVTLGDCEPIEGSVVEVCQTETELLLRWCELITRLDPDIMTGYNILGFDMSYMYDRAIELGVKIPFCKIGRIVECVSTFQEKVLSSSALGDNILKFLDMEGRVIVDIMKVVQRDHKLDSYKLDAVANHFMSMNKNDVSPNDIFRLQKGSPADRKTIAEYCIQDCALCNKLMMKLEIIANNVGMANVCYVPLSFIFMRGQGVKIFSLVAKQCKEDGFLIPTRNKGKIIDADGEQEEEEGYEGAIVLEPQTGIYTEDPVSVLDYASLYPSSMISENLSHDCIVEIGGKFDNLPNVEYLDISYDIYEKRQDKKIKIGERVCRFTQNEKGVIPRILMKLIRQRKETRKRIEFKTVTSVKGEVYTGLYTTKDDSVKIMSLDGTTVSLDATDIVSVVDTYNEFTKAVLDGLQNAYKVTANSLYGQIGAKTSPIYLKDIAACTTATGRNLILKAKSFIEQNYIGAKIVYGDSVPGDTPLLIKYSNGYMDIQTINSIALPSEFIPYRNFKPLDDAIDHDTKEQAFTDALIWTDQGWSPIRRIIRHKTTKRIYRVNTFQGCVDVTEDHSLIGTDMKEVKPIDCIPGRTTILHSFPTDGPLFFDDALNQTPEEAWLWGLYFACGNCDNGVWGLDTLNINVLKKATRYLELQRTKRSEEHLCAKYIELFHTGNGYKRIPYQILNAPLAVRQQFIKGYKASLPAQKLVSCVCKGKLAAQGLYFVLKSIGYDALSITMHARANYASDVYCISEKPLNVFEECRDTVSQIVCTKDVNTTADHVYDIETDIGRFHAGIGSIVCKNTDSIMVMFPNEITDEHGVKRKLKGEEAIQHAIETGMEASKKFKQYLKPPHDLEMEKVFHPFILISKKRYCALKYENNPKKGKLNSMGIALKRRDNAPIVKTVYGGVIDIIMHQQDVDKSIEFLKDCIQKLIDGKYPLEDLVITKSLRADYKDPTRIAHRALADRMSERDPGNKPQVNDRIPYVYVQVQSKSKKKEKLLQGDRIEHPDHIRKMDLKPDYEFYITNQIMKPVSQIYALVLESMKGYRNGPDYYKKMEAKLMVEKGGDLKKVRDRIADLREQEVHELLFQPFLRKLENKRNGNREITDWFGAMRISSP